MAAPKDGVNQAALTLPSQERVSVTRDQVIRTAGSMDEAVEDDRVYVVVSGRRLSAVELIAGAAGVDPVDVRVRGALDVLSKLGYHPPMPHKRDRAPRVVPTSGEVREQLQQTAEADAGAVTAPLSDAVASRLRRYQGNWVALRTDTVVGSGPTLQAALADVDTHDGLLTTVLYVPPPARVDPLEV